MYPDLFALQALPDFWCVVVSVCMLTGIALYAWQHRSQRGAIWQAWLQVAKAVMLISILMMLAVRSGQGRELWQEVYLVLSLAVCYTWLEFIVAVGRELNPGKRRSFVALRGIFIVFAMGTFTNGIHHRLWTRVWVEGNNIQCDATWLCGVIVASAYGVAVYSMWLNIRWAMALSGLRRRQAFSFLLPSLAALAGQLLSNLPHRAEFEPNTIGFTLASVLMIWAFKKWHTYSILPLARLAAAECLADSLIVVDESHCVVALNSSAGRLLDRRQIRPGSGLHEVEKLWPDLQKVIMLEPDSASKLCFQDGERYYEGQVTSFGKVHKAVPGKVIVLRDITLEHRQQQIIIEQQKALATLKERELLGQEMHDGPGQQWSFLAAQTQAARLYIAKGKTDRADLVLAQLQDFLRQYHAGVRESIMGLQASMQHGIEGAIKEQLRWYEAHCGITSRLVVDPGWTDAMLGLGAAPQVLRILQEALANVRKSSEATHVNVSLGVVDGEMQFEVRDNGKGFHLSQAEQKLGSHGLRIMRQRAQEIGARLQIDSQPGRGCIVSLRVPFRMVPTIAVDGHSAGSWVQ